MSLLDAQFFFSWKVCDLLRWLQTSGYTVTFGEVYRPPQMAEWYASKGQGITDSNHIRRLAVDLNVFKDGKLLQSIDELRDIGNFWKSLGTIEYRLAWGGDFERTDTDHYSCIWQGIK